MKHDETALTEGAANAQVLAREIDWLEAVMSARFAAYGAEAGRAPAGPTEPPPPPPLQPAHHAHPPHPTPGPYASLVHELALGVPERLLLALALAPHIAPERLAEHHAEPRAFNPGSQFKGKEEGLRQWRRASSPAQEHHRSRAKQAFELRKVDRSLPLIGLGTQFDPVSGLGHLVASRPELDPLSLKGAHPPGRVDARAAGGSIRLHDGILSARD